ncbi:complex I subunit 1/NuoH family protein [Aquirufa rosea]|uniref:NADH-quinone oxidoreductase subunit H n=1 Tax=Aquirufa rosea TaxID=2509241 RepID=A0A4Q1C2X8_9BACT|nr:complex I subunit 1 family protein [Aquirufa rosea]RXK52548.1 NADH-quinone oxidoreductase subunit H [Aquirufa rosea]
MWIALVVCLILLTINVVVGVYVERKLSAFMQDRLGPMEAGKWGLLQVFADLLKLFQKEDIVPASAQRQLFMLAPWIIFLSVFGAFSVIPLSSGNFLQGSQTEMGVMLLMGIVSLDTLGILLAGWTSNNKYSLLGAIRSAAQLVSYEIPLGLSILCVILISSSLNLQEIALQQGVFSSKTNYLFGLSFLDWDVSRVGGILTWNVVRVPFFFFLFILFFIASLAEANRAPFDIPEAESELVGGFHTEYAGMRWALLFLSEYGMMLLVSVLGVILFWGAWYSPFPNVGSLRLADWTNGTPGTIAATLLGFMWLMIKTYLLIALQMWVRWTLPRLRVDQLMYLCWKVLTPAALVFVALSSIWSMFM